VGRKAPLSASVISRLTQKFRQVYEEFDRRNLDDRKYVYVWADGIYLKAGLGTAKACLMFLIGADKACACQPGPCCLESPRTSACFRIRSLA